MSILKVDTIDAGSKIDFPHGFNVGGLSPAQVYTSSASVPSSSSPGDFWYDSTNKILYQYIDNAFKRIFIQPAKFYPKNYKYVASQKVSLTGFDAYPSLFTIGKDDKTVVISGTAGDDLELARLETAKDMSTLPSSPQTSTLGAANNFETQPRGSFWHPDGDYLFACGTATDDLDRWSCPTPFSLLGATNDQTNTAALSAINPTSLYFSPDGTKALFCGLNERLYKATLSTAWDVSTSSLTLDTTNFFNLNDELGSNGTMGYSVAHEGGLWVSDDGYYCIVVTTTGRGGMLHWGVMTTAWDITTLTFNPSDMRTTNHEENENVRGLAFSSDGSHMYMLDNTNKVITYLEWEPE